jgi:tRNA(fMet)-specific endonuclease VapC
LATLNLLDTNSVSFIAAKHPEVLKNLGNLTHNDEIYTCFVVIGEWEAGIIGAKSLQREAEIRRDGGIVFQALSGIWESTPTVSAEYGRIAALLRKTGQLIPTNDIWIAAVALTHGATFITNDPHFQRIPNLKTLDRTVP